MTAQGNVEVNVNSDNLKDFLSRYGLHGPDSLQCSKLDKGWVKVSETNEKYADDDTSDDITMMKVYGLCIGKYKEGERIKMSAAINDGIDPPKFSPCMQTVQRRLTTISSLSLPKALFIHI